MRNRAKVRTNRSRAFPSVALEYPIPSYLFIHYELALLITWFPGEIHKAVLAHSLRFTFSLLFEHIYFFSSTSFVLRSLNGIPNSLLICYIFKGKRYCVKGKETRSSRTYIIYIKEGWVKPSLRPIDFNVFEKAHIFRMQLHKCSFRFASSINLLRYF